jgi:hypothetical protein
MRGKPFRGDHGRHQFTQEERSRGGKANLRWAMYLKLWLLSFLQA